MLRSRCRQTSGELPVLLNSGEPSYVAGVARFGELPVLLNSGELVALLSLNLGCASCLKALAFAY